MRKLTAVLFLGLPLTAAAEGAKSTGNRTTPPTIQAVMPHGIPAGATTEIHVDGLNLTDASAIYFDRPGLKGRVKSIRQLPDLPDIRLGSAGLPSTIDLGPLPPRMRVTLEVTADAGAQPSVANFRLLTPLGTTPAGRVLLERNERVISEVENEPAEAAIPSVLNGTIRKPGDTDDFRFRVQAGEKVTFDNPSMRAGSSLQPVFRILREDGSTEAEYGADGGPSANRFTHTFAKAGTYTLRISDFLQSGKETHFYRVRVAKDAAPPMEMASMAWIPKESGGDARLKAAGTNTSLKTAQAVQAPAWVEGVIDAAGREHFYRFRGAKGKPVALEVIASRHGSELDPVIDIFDASGKPVEIAVARAVFETNLVLRDHESTNRNFRLSSINGFTPGDWLMLGSEIVKLEALPLQPDADILVESFGGQRYSYFGTSGEAHHLDRAVHRVEIHPPGSKFSPNGLPLVRLYARNDDGGPMYGKDSIFLFEPPADGDYVVRVRDTRGAGGPEFAYKLAVRPPRPDFQLSLSPANPNVPAGGSIPVTVTAFRVEGFNQPIEVEVSGLPAGLKATRGVIAPGQDSTTVLLMAEPGAKLAGAAPLEVVGRSGALIHAATSPNRLNLVAIAQQPDIVVTAETKVVEVELGGSAEVTVAIDRQNGFGGRVPIEVRNLPPHVRVPDVGLNGVLINEDENRRTFLIEALDVAAPTEQVIYLGGRVETRSESPVYAAPQPILLRVKKPKTVSAGVR